ncbi:551_t:CDS:2 [Ambispora leptoticha]|uniref:551_t:CDS:1 n=1 Tax=Ambispora leptoticha TaxID=144679 RepID=A0A9N9G0V5_9GLOM|nr:551_t:CDS:2 [Ambispora leptoticha]
MSSKYLTILCRDFGQMLEEADDYNVIIEVGEEPNVKTFKAHDNILKARCSYIYTGIVSLNDHEDYTIHDLLIAVDELFLTDLFDYIQEHLIAFRSKWILENFIIVMTTAFQYENFKLLQKYCLDLLCKDPVQCLNIDYISFLNENILAALLNRSDLEMNEADLWVYLLEWGISHSGISYSDPAIWTDEHFKILETKLRNLIPFIRFSQFSSTQWRRLVKPYKQILPLKLYTALEKEFSLKSLDSKPTPPAMTISPQMTPRNASINSVLINTRHLGILATWISRKDDNPFNDGNIVHDFRNIPYQLKLLLRGTRDGFSTSAFHNKCDNKDATIVIMKIRESGRLIGGYNPIGWSSRNMWVNSRYCFIFSFDDGIALHKSVLSRVVDPSRAVLCSQMIGACFGSGDLVMGGARGDFDMDLACSSNIQSYEKPITNLDRFSVEEYEVFQVMRRLRTC